VHPYGVDSNERRNVLIILVILSLLLSELSRRLVVAQGWTVPTTLDWIFDPASGAAWFAALFYLFENYAWRWQLLHRVRFVQIANLNGQWEGTMRSSYDKFATEHHIQLTIKQNWSLLIVELATARSTSKSDTASVFVNEGVDPILVYTYRNTPNADQLDSMGIHTGTTTLTLRDTERGEQLKGQYYSGRGRGNYGDMTAYRVSY
jgi:hypothetical protein